MKCSYCLSVARYKCTCPLPYMCIACLGAHLDTLEEHPFEIINIELENSRLNRLRSKIQKRLNYIDEAKSEIVKSTKNLIKSLENQCKQAIGKLELLSKDLIELYKHNKFCRSDMPTVEKIESGGGKDEYNTEKIIKSMSLLNILTKNQCIGVAKLESNVELNQKSSLDYFQLHPKPIDISFQNKKVMCPIEHFLKFFSIVKDRNRTANKSLYIVVDCDMCMASDIKSCWSCIECIYDLCEPCFTLASQNPQASTVSKNFEPICPKNHKLVDYSLIRPLDAKFSPKSNIICSYCNYNDLESGKSCILCYFYLCKQCSNDQIYAKPALNLTNQFCPSSHPLYYFQNTGEFMKRKNNCLSVLSCNACLHSWNGGSWGCRLCDFYLCIKCINRKKEPGVLKTKKIF